MRKAETSCRRPDLVAGAIVALGLILAACSGPQSEKTDPVVATLGERDLTHSQLVAYLESNLLALEEGEPLAAAELDRVKSRLFENLIEEELLLIEAERRGIGVSDAEVDRQLGLADPAATTASIDAARRRLAQRHVMVQKLRSTVIGDQAAIREEQIDAYLERHRDRLMPEHRVVLRFLTLGGPKEARRIRREIVGTEMSFDQAIQVFGEDPEAAKPLAIDLDMLPEEIHDALAELEPGEVSPPVEFNGKTYLFMMEAKGPDARPPETTLRDRAREALLREQAREATEALVARLHREIPVTLHTTRLPFNYSPE